MHIIVAALTAIAGLVWALYRLQNSGVDLNAFNPFHWMRRRQWEKQLSIKPLHRLDTPMEAAAVLVVATIKTEGEVTREQKTEVIALFEEKFKLNKQRATELFASSAFLLQDTLDYAAEVKHILAPCQEIFTTEQIESSLELIRSAALLDGEISTTQERLLDAVKSVFEASNSHLEKWS